MKTAKFPRILSALIAFACLVLPHVASACAVCYGKSDSKLAEGMNWGIFTLLVVVVSVLGGIGAFFIYLARRSSALAAVPTSLSESINKA